MNFNIGMGIPEMEALWNELNRSIELELPIKQKNNYIKSGEMH